MSTAKGGGLFSFRSGCYFVTVFGLALLPTPPLPLLLLLLLLLLPLILSAYSSSDDDDDDVEASLRTYSLSLNGQATCLLLLDKVREILCMVTFHSLAPFLRAWQRLAVFEMGYDHPLP